MLLYFYLGVLNKESLKQYFIIFMRYITKGTRYCYIYQILCIVSTLFNFILHQKQNLKY
jgi:hypothetical protein